MARIIKTLRSGWDQYKNDPEAFFAPAYWDSRPIMDAMTYPLVEGEPPRTPQEDEARYIERLRNCSAELTRLATEHGMDEFDYLVHVLSEPIEG